MSAQVTALAALPFLALGAVATLGGVAFTAFGQRRRGALAASVVSAGCVLLVIAGLILGSRHWRLAWADHVLAVTLACTAVLWALIARSERHRRARALAAKAAAEEERQRSQGWHRHTRGD